MPDSEKLRSTLVDGTTSAEVLRVRTFRGRNGRSRVTRSPGEVAPASTAALPKREH